MNRYQQHMLHEDLFKLHLTYNGAYESMYEAGYEFGFVFYDVEEFDDQDVDDSFEWDEQDIYNA